MLGFSLTSRLLRIDFRWYLFAFVSRWALAHGLWQNGLWQNRTLARSG